METDRAEGLRQKIKEIRKERDNATLEKGLAAEENKDLRENFAYDYWEQKERTLTHRIHNLIKEIEELVPIKFSKARKSKQKKKKAL